jgi:ribosome biogenesis protein MAK21
VAAEDVFFHKYFNSLGKEKTKVKVKARQEADEESVADGEESEIWKAMMDSAPDLEGVDDSDDDIEMEDLESDFERSLNEMSSDLDEAGEDEDLEDDDDIDDGSERLERASLDSLDGSLMVLPEGPSDDAGPILSAKRPGKSSKSTNPNKERRKRMKGLPTFASASDYAKMLEDEDGEDLG